MVLGPKTKSRRGPTVQVDYQILVEEIKPWPPSQNMKAVRSVLIQWENGDKSSGSTSSVVPSVSESRIEFNESFRLPATLSRDMSVKNGDVAVFHKNLLELNLYEPRRDKTVKGQLLGTAILDLADYGGLKEAKRASIPLNCTRTFRNTSQPFLHLRIQPGEKGRLSSSSRPGFQKQASNEEYSEEAEFASLTDDDGSSHSSLTAESVGSLAAPNSTDGSVTAKENDGSGKEFHAQSSKIDDNKSVTRSEIQAFDNQKGSSVDTSIVDLSSQDSQRLSPSNGSPSTLNVSVAVTKSDSGDNVSNAQSSVSSVGVESCKDTQGGGDSYQNIQENMPNSFTSKPPSHDMYVHVNVNVKDGTEPQAGDGDEDSGEIVNTYDIHDVDSKEGQEDEDEGYSAGGESSHRDSLTSASGRKNESSLGMARLNHARSLRSSTDSVRSNGSVGGNNISIERKEAKVYPSERRNGAPEGKILDLERKIKMLEGELREAAAIEASLYSVVAEHGSSVSKVHAPARRLSRMYIQAVKGNKSRRANAAQTAVSGLVVVAKACGNDVPRLTFWLSNCVVLRAIITQAFEEQQLPVSDGPSIHKDAVGNRSDKNSPKLRWKASSSNKKDTRGDFSGSFDDWQDPFTFTSALEKVESWIFSRIVESVWWQTLTPHMQSSAAKVVDKLIDSGSKKSFRRASSSGGQEQVNLSLELWKKAFKDACERLCPVRAGGHECGCLTVLAKLGSQMALPMIQYLGAIMPNIKIMEQCVARLDVAMFNAILRESNDDIPTDPLSDPISEAKVLPIPSGRSSFGAGAQLKNAIGNWSRWLTDLFGMDDDDDPLEDDDSHNSDSDDDKRRKQDSSFKSFHLLKSLSDLMMLPKDMLLSGSIRKEVCPTFSVHIIKRVLDNFVPDEFCPDPVPDEVMEALESEDISDEGNISSVPCTAPSALYAPPPASSLASFIGDVGTQSPLRRSSSMLRKSNTSDDELDELDSPLSRIIDNLQASPRPLKPSTTTSGTSGASVIRYQLLREIWMGSE